jgi:hypothetical protein
MAESLVELKASMDTASAKAVDPAAASATQTSAPAVAGPPARLAAPPVRGDDLLSKARESYMLNDDHARAIRLFAGSKQALADQIANDPEYGAKILPELQKKKGADLALGIIGAVDDIKIEQWKKSEENLPEHQKTFSSQQAAKYAFFNSSTMGQLSRIMGGAAQLVDGRPWQDVAEEQAEKMRLLARAFPGNTFAGETASFFMPGSLVGKVFQKAAFLGGPVAKGIEGAAKASGLEGAIGSVIAKVIRDPKTLERARAIVGDTASGMVRSGVGTAAGMSAINGIQGTLGTGTQEFSFDRGKEMAADTITDPKAYALGALAPLIGGAMRGGLMAASGPVNYTAGAIEKNVGKVVSELSTVPVESIRAYNRFPEAVRKAAGTENRNGMDLVDHILGDESKVVQIHEARQLLPQLPDVSPQKTIDFLRSFKKGAGDPKIDPHIDTLHEWANRMETEAAGGDMTAVQMEAWKKKFQAAADDQYGKESGFYDSALKDAGRISRMSILESAAKGGEVGKTYSDLMEKGAKTVDVLRFIRKELGGSVDAMLKNAEKQSDKWFGKNTTFKQERLKELDTAQGTSFVENFQNAQHAENLGITKPGDTPAWTSRSTTGRSTLGTKLGASAGSAMGGIIGHVSGAGAPGVALGTTVGGAAGAFAGSVASSPKLGSLVVGTSDRITQLMRNVVKDPRALQLVAGELPQPGRLAGYRPAGAAQEANEIAAKRLKVPYESAAARRNTISTALEKGRAGIRGLPSCASLPIPHSSPAWFTTSISRSENTRTAI